MSYLYSKLPETGVSSLIGTGGDRLTVVGEQLPTPTSEEMGQL